MPVSGRGFGVFYELQELTFLQLIIFIQEDNHVINKRSESDICL